MKKRELTIAHHGRCVYGYFYEPDTKEYPLVIMSHGYNGHKSDLLFRRSILPIMVSVRSAIPSAAGV